MAALAEYKFGIDYDLLAKDVQAKLKSDGISSDRMAMRYGIPKTVVGSFITRKTLTCYPSLILCFLDYLRPKTQIQRFDATRYVKETY